MKRGECDRLITVQRATVTTDDYGGETQNWSDLEEVWARVEFGLSQEKREAAQEGGQQTATFKFGRTNKLDGVALKDRIFFHEDETYWDITEIAPLSRRDMRLTGVRAL